MRTSHGAQSSGHVQAAQRPRADQGCCLGLAGLASPGHRVARGSQGRQGQLGLALAPASHRENRQAAWGRVSRNNSPEAQCRPGLCLSGSRPQACHQLCSRCHCAERSSPQQWQEGARGVEGTAPQEATRVATLLLLMTMRCPGQLRTAGQEAWQVPEALTPGLLGGLTFQRPRPGADLFVPGRDSGGLLTTEGQLGWALAPGFFGGHTLTLDHPAGTLPSSPGQPQPPASSPRVPANTR